MVPGLLTNLGLIALWDVNMNIIKKLLHRLTRILQFKKGAWCYKCGKGNVFSNGIHLSEDSSIGSYNFFGRNVGLNYTSVGNYCSIAPNVQVGPGMHALDFLSTSQRLAGPVNGHQLVSRQTIIGSDVWIGVNAVVLQGVHVGTGAVIGANSVVTKDVGEYCIVSGVPAKFMRMRFDLDTQAEITNSGLLNSDLEKAREIASNLRSVLR